MGNPGLPPGTSSVMRREAAARAAPGFAVPALACPADTAGLDWIRIVGQRNTAAANRSCKCRCAPVSCRRGSAQLCRSTQAGARRHGAGSSGAPTQALKAAYGHPLHQANNREALRTRAARYPAQHGPRSTGCVRRCAARGDLPSETQILPAAADVTFGARIRGQLVCGTRATLSW
jgi:hypothetical protein